MTITQELLNSPSHNSGYATTVDLLFGWSPNEIHGFFDFFYTNTRCCTLALFEMVEVIWQNQEKHIDVSYYIGITRPFCIVAKLERIRIAYDRFFSLFRCDSKELVSNNEIDENKKNAANVLHKEFMHIVEEIDKVDAYDFFKDVAAVIEYVETKDAYVDIAYAMACTMGLYIGYIKNQCEVKCRKQQ